MLHDGKYRDDTWKVIHMSTQIWGVEITAITAVSFCDAVNAIAVIAMLGIGGLFLTHERSSTTGDDQDQRPMDTAGALYG
jgi:hypothetical protein